MQNLGKTPSNQTTMNEGLYLLEVQLNVHLVVLEVNFHEC